MKLTLTQINWILTGIQFSLQGVPISTISQKSQQPLPRRQVKAARENFKKRSFRIKNEVYLDVIREADVLPTVDAFASQQSKQLPRFWTPKQDAFKQSWSNEVLWLCPPFKLLQDTVEQIYKDQAQGLIIVPIWKHKAWFQALGNIAIWWKDFDPDHEIFLDGNCSSIPAGNGWRFRVVHFNAYGQKDWDSSKLTSSCVRENGISH